MGFAAIRKIGLQNLLPTSTPIISSTAVNGHLSQLINHPIKGAYWAAKATDDSPNLSLSLKQPILMNALVLQEPIAMGQRIRKFHVEITNTLGETERINLQTIGNKRIIPFKQRKVSAIKITFDESRGQVLISNLELLNLISTRSEPLYR
jgi:alpha-L-fucosidase